VERYVWRTTMTDETKRRRRTIAEMLSQDEEKTWDLIIRKGVQEGRLTRDEKKELADKIVARIRAEAKPTPHKADT
jgi:hypothetical protein